MIGVVLAGGASRRMGRPKHDFLVGERTMADWVVAALGVACDEVVVAGSSLEGLTAIPDAPGRARTGPLAGVLAALQWAGRPILAVAVDHPWVRAETLARLIELANGSDQVVPIHDDVRQVTCAVYTPDLQRARDATSIQAALDAVDHRLVSRETWMRWHEDGRSWFSVDTPADADRGLEQFGLPRG